MVIIWHADSKYKTKGETKNRINFLVQLWLVFVEVNVACIIKKALIFSLLKIKLDKQWDS